MAIFAAAARTCGSSRRSRKRGKRMPEPMNRRQFFGLAGGGILVLFSAEAQGPGSGRRMMPALPQNLDAWLHIGEHGAVTVYTGKVEVGQNIRTSLSQAVSEE